jgi:glucose/arabinose dehydrogenase
MLRIDSDGSIPSDNPLLNKTTGKYQAIWAYGMRNPFTFAIRDDGLMLINDVGGKFEEINVGVAGGNFGWPIIQHGRVQKPEFQDPIHWYPEASISGGDFLTEEMAKAGNWPTKFAGRYFFADFKHGWLHTIDPDNARKADDFASGLRRPVDLRFSGDGTLYVLLRNAWVIDDKFQGGTSSLLAIQPK